MNTKPEIVREIEKILGNGIELQLPKPINPYNPLDSLMGSNHPKYLTDADGKLIGLNLASTGMSDAKWAIILTLPSFPARHLRGLNLFGNNLTLFPAAEEMASLERLDINENKIIDLYFIGHLPNLTIFIYETANIISPSPELLKQGWQNFRRHFERLIEAEKANAIDYLYEAKVLLVGRTGAGKTSLRYKLKNINHRMPKHDESTRGIDVEPLEFPIDGGRTFRMNIWDFEGQQISYQTHQFFLTNRSMYVFVADQRTEKSDFEYWFQIVELLGDKSPLIIFQNEKKSEGETKGQICSVNLDGLRERFGEILCDKEFQVNLDLISADKSPDPLHIEAFEKFRIELAKRLLGLPHVGEQLPRSWVKVREELEEMASKRDHISLKEFQDLCDKNGIKGKQEQKDLDKLFHDLGIFLHFQSTGEPSVLSKIVILNNLWATKAVYEVLKSDMLREAKRGHFTLEDLKEVWAGTNHVEHAEELLELMSKKHFEICYKVADTQVYIAPQLLPPSPPPDYSFPENEEVLQIRYSYDFIPKGLITRLTVRMHPFIARKQTLAWKDGFVVELKNGAIAQVSEYIGKREIRIKATGEFRRKLLNQIVYEMDRLNDQYNFPTQSPANKMLPCCCGNCIGSTEPYFFVYQQVINYKEGGWAQAPCGNKGSAPASVDGLLSILIEGNEHELHNKKKVNAALDALQKGQEAHRKENTEGFIKVFSKLEQHNQSIEQLRLEIQETSGNELDLSKLESNYESIKQQLDKLAKLPSIESIPALHEKLDYLKSQSDKKSSIKVVGNLFPTIIQEVLPLIPNVQYEYEVDPNLGVTALVKDLLQSFKKVCLYPKKQENA